MSDLIVVSAQPNPPGRDRANPGSTQNWLLNEEWVELRASASRQLSGDEVRHRTFSSYCVPTGEALYHKFELLRLEPGQSVRIHTGKGDAYWEGGKYHVFAGHGWFKWNNACGDRASIAFSGEELDYATYAPNPPEGELVRKPHSHLLVPRSQFY